MDEIKPSFAHRVKDEIINSRLKHSCCKEAQMNAFVLCCGATANSTKCFKTQNAVLAEFLVKHLKTTLGITVNHHCSNETTHYIEYTLKSSIHVDFKCNGCAAAFISGAFLASGRISNPLKEYNLEILLVEQNFEILKAAFEQCSISVLHKVKQQKTVLYLKKSTDIEDSLTLMGATNCSLEVMNAKIYKDIRNSTNRITNLDTANMKKTGIACARHLEAIKRLSEHNKLESLPQELYEIAIARQENIDISVAELGKMFVLSRSGVHHRLSKIVEISEKIK